MKIGAQHCSTFRHRHKRIVRKFVQAQSGHAQQKTTLTLFALARVILICSSVLFESAKFRGFRSIFYFQNYFIKDSKKKIFSKIRKKVASYGQS